MDEWEGIITLKANTNSNTAQNTIKPAVSSSSTPKKTPTDLSFLDDPFDFENMSIKDTKRSTIPSKTISSTAQPIRSNPISPIDFLDDTFGLGSSTTSTPVKKPSNAAPYDIFSDFGGASSPKVNKTINQEEKPKTEAIRRTSNPRSSISPHIDTTPQKNGSSAFEDHRSPSYVSLSDAEADEVPARYQAFRDADDGDTHDYAAHREVDLSNHSPEPTTQSATQKWSAFGNSLLSKAKVAAEKAKVAAEKATEKAKIATEKYSKEMQQQVQQQVQQAQEYVSAYRRPQVESQSYRENSFRMEHPDQSIVPFTDEPVPSRVRTAEPRAATPVKIVEKPKPPLLSQETLTSVSENKSAGTDSFKKGDYAAASDHYSRGLNHIPSDHPARAVLYSNRAAARLKTGEYDGVVGDCDQCLALIARWSDEDGIKLKVLTRKAQAYEGMEKWQEAGKIWQQVLENGGAGGQGLERCRKALRPISEVQRTSTPTPSKPKEAPIADLFDPLPQDTTPEVKNGPPLPDGQRVVKMRQAAEQESRVEEEQLKVKDEVDAIVIMILAFSCSS